MNLEPIGAVVEFLSFFFDRKEIDKAKTKAAIDAAEKYIMVNEGDSPYEKLTPEKRRLYLKHFKKRFIAYN